LSKYPALQGQLFPESVLKAVESQKVQEALVAPLHCPQV
jgi:hypothetical protein